MVKSPWHSNRPSARPSARQSRRQSTDNDGSVLAHSTPPYLPENSDVAAFLHYEPPSLDLSFEKSLSSPSEERESDMEKSDEKATEQEKQPPSAIDPSAFPDGGLKAWSVVLGGFCSLFCSFGWINSVGVFQSYYEAHQLRAYSPSTISWISSLEVCMMFLWGPIIGKLFDNYGPRYIVLAGTFFHVFGLMMTSISSKYYQFVLAQGICSPIGSSLVFYPALTSTSTWFFKNRAFAMGVVASGSSVGGIIIPVLVQKLIPQVGFGWAIRVTAFMILGLLVVSNLTIKSRLPPRPRPLILMEFIHPLYEPIYSITLVASFLFMLCVFIPITFIVVQAEAQGMSPNLAQYLVVMLNAGSLFGRVLPGYVADRIGRYNVLIILTSVTAAFVLGLWIPSKTNAAIIVFTVIYGFGSGAFVSLVPPIIAQITKDMSKIGVRTGTIFAVMSIAALIGTPIAGALVTFWNGRFTGLQIFAGTIELAGSVVYLIARIVSVGFKITAKF